jgi:hypothetical protein
MSGSGLNYGLHRQIFVTALQGKLAEVDWSTVEEGAFAGVAPTVKPANEWGTAGDDFRVEVGIQKGSRNRQNAGTTLREYQTSGTLQLVVVVPAGEGPERADRLTRVLEGIICGWKLAGVKLWASSEPEELSTEAEDGYRLLIETDYEVFDRREEP